MHPWRTSKNLRPRCADQGTSEIHDASDNLTSEGHDDEVDEALSVEMQDAWIAIARD
jgi:hypothetical protein